MQRCVKRNLKKVIINKGALTNVLHNCMFPAIIGRIFHAPNPCSDRVVTIVYIQKHILHFRGAVTGFLEPVQGAFLLTDPIETHYTE